MLWVRKIGDVVGRQWKRCGTPAWLWKRECAPIELSAGCIGNGKVSIVRDSEWYNQEQLSI